MIEKNIFERSQRMIAYGSCAFLPTNELMPLLLTLFQEKAVTSEIVSEEKLIQGLKNHVYQLVILHQPLQESSDDGRIISYYLTGKSSSGIEKNAHFS